MADKQRVVGLNTIYNLLVIWHGNGNEYSISVGLSGHWVNWPLDFCWLSSVWKVPNTCMNVSLQLGGTGRVCEGREQISKNTELVVLKCMLLCCHVHWPMKSDREQDILVTQHLGWITYYLAFLRADDLGLVWICLNLKALQTLKFLRQRIRLWASSHTPAPLFGSLKAL